MRHASGVRGKKLLDAIRSGTGNGVEIACLELKKDAEKSDFAAAEFAAVGRRVTGGAIRALVSAFSDDLAELAAACQQLLADATDEITEATVEKYYSGRIETNAFKVADAAIAGRRGEALVLLRHALASGADPVPIVAAFAAKLRTMAKVAGSTCSRRTTRCKSSVSRPGKSIARGATCTAGPTMGSAARFSALPIRMSRSKALVAIPYSRLSA